jgi:hypothetical protein
VYLFLRVVVGSSDGVVSENVVCEKDVGVEELSVRYAVPGKKSDGSDLCKQLGVTLLVKQS